MRSILKKVMEARNENSITLSEKSGVPQPTISRFLSGEHKDMRSTTLRKLAPHLMVSESQLRGDVPIDWLSIDLTTTSTVITNEKEDAAQLLKKFGITKEKLTLAQVERVSEFLKGTPEQQNKALNLIKEDQTGRSKKKGNGEKGK